MKRYDKPIAKEDRRDFIRYMKKQDYNGLNSWEQVKLYNTTDCKMYLFKCKIKKFWRIFKDSLY